MTGGSVGASVGTSVGASVEISDMNSNLNDLEKLVEFIYNNIQYVEFKHKK